jgi:chromate reductase
MSDGLRVVGFAGSLRRGSLNHALLRAAGELAPPGVEVEIVDLLPIPLYNADIEAGGLPEPVLAFRERIAAADALLIATPEYNFSYSGVLKNAIDWASRPPRPSPLDDKPLAIVGAGGRMGTTRAQYHLRQVMMHLNTHALNRPEVAIVRASEKFDHDGRLVDEETRALVRDLMLALADWTRRLRRQS